MWVSGVKSEKALHACVVDSINQNNIIQHPNLLRKPNAPVTHPVPALRHGGSISSADRDAEDEEDEEELQADLSCSQGLGSAGGG